MQAQHRAGLLARGHERVPVAGVQRREPEPLGKLGERHRGESPLGVRPYFCGALDRIEQPGELERDDPLGVGARPLFEVPVVGRPDHGPGQLRVAHPELVALTGKAGQR